MARVLTDENRMAIAHGWPTARARGFKQDEYARACGVAPRTLRAYLKRWPPEPVRAEHELHAFLKRAVEQLQDLLAALDADAAGCDGRPSQARPDTDRQPERGKALAASDCQPLTTKAAPGPDRKVPGDPESAKPSFSWS